MEELSGSVLFLLLIFYMSFIILMLVSFWKIFSKAGEDGWKSIIPVYSAIVMLKIVGKPWWWIFMLFIPLMNIVFLVWMYNMLSKSFGKDEGFTAGMFLLGFIFFPILGLGQAEYQGPYGNPEAYRQYRQRLQGFDFEQEDYQA